MTTDEKDREGGVVILERWNESHSGDPQHHVVNAAPVTHPLLNPDSTQNNFIILTYTNDSYTRQLYGAFYVSLSPIDCHNLPKTAYQYPSQHQNVVRTLNFFGKSNINTNSYD